MKLSTLKPIPRLLISLAAGVLVKEAVSRCDITGFIDNLDKNEHFYPVPDSDLADIIHKTTGDANIFGALASAGVFLGLGGKKEAKESIKSGIRFAKDVDETIKSCVEISDYLNEKDGRDFGNPTNADERDMMNAMDPFREVDLMLERPDQWLAEQDL